MSRPAPRHVSAACLLSIFLGAALLAQTPPPTPPPKPPVKNKPAAAPAKVAPAAPAKVAPVPEPPPPPSDVKVHTRYTRGAEVSENTTYVRGPRQRVEFAGVVEANSSTELMPTLAAGGSLAETLFGSTADGTSSAAPKQPGRIRVGVLEPANKTSRTLAARQLREQLVGEFRKAPFEALALAGLSAADIQQDAARLGCDYILFTEVTDIKTSKPGRVTGLLKRTAGEDATRDIHDVELDYKLYAVGGTAAPAATGSSRASSGGGVGVGTALKLVAIAGRMYLSMYGMGGMGLGTMNPLLSIPGLGSGVGSFAASGLFDPRTKAMNSMTQMVGMAGMSGLGAMAGAGSSGDDSEAIVTQTVGTALGRAAKSTMEQLQTRKK